MGKRIFFAAFFLLILSVIIAVVIYNKLAIVEVSANKLAHDYYTDKDFADEKYLDKIIHVKGEVKAYYKLFGARPVLELETDDFDTALFGFFLDKKTQEKASSLVQGQYATVIGKCVGLDAYGFVKGVKIEVEDIEVDE